MINKSITIEELVSDYPDSVKYLMDKGIRCIKCGEPIWGNFDSVCKEKGFSDSDIDLFVSELNDLII